MARNSQKPKTQKGGVWQKLLDALYADLGNIVSNEKLIKVSGQHNYARRVRELRAEPILIFNIITKLIGLNFGFLRP